MNNFTERTWTLVTINAAIKELMKTYVQVSATQVAERDLHWSDHHPEYERFQNIRDSSRRTA